MNDIRIIFSKVRHFSLRQHAIDLCTYLVLACSVTLISLTVSLLLLKSPLYALIGIVPLLFFRPTSLLRHAARLEKKLGLAGELVNSMQLSRIPTGSKEHYSRELIIAYIQEAAKRIKDVPVSRYLDLTALHTAVRILFISLILALAYPAFMPARFRYSLAPSINHLVHPGSISLTKGSEVELSLILNGVYLPRSTKLVIDDGTTRTEETITLLDSKASKKIQPNESISYFFAYSGNTTEPHTVTTIEPVYIEALSFQLVYPAYTGLKPETKRGRQIIAPVNTKILLEGRASQELSAAGIVLDDTVTLNHSGKNFTGEFVIRKSATALLFLESSTACSEAIILYAIPDLDPLVDIFYPGFNISMPSDMHMNVRIKCSDDYGLAHASFVYALEDEYRKPLYLTKNALDDTISFTWDLSVLNMFPGDEVTYYVEITDNAGNKTASKHYTVYFPTVDEIYEEVSRKDQVLQSNLEAMHTEQETGIDEIARIEQKLMKERELSWADQEKLKEILSQQKEVVERIEDWQNELERTINKLNEGVIIDPKSLEHLHEIAKIMQDIVPEEFRQALEQLQMQLEQHPDNLQQAIENAKQRQEELAKALERTLELLRRYQQEEKLKELAEKAEELAQKASDLKKSLEEFSDANFDEDISELQREIESLESSLQELADSKGLEEEVKRALEELAKQTGNMETQSPAALDQTQQSLSDISADLQMMYESLTQGRATRLRQKLMDIFDQLITISKEQEKLISSDAGTDADRQNNIITATKAVAESLFAQQNKNVYVTPRMNKNIAKAVTHMEKSLSGQPSAYHREEAMKSINTACMEILKTMEQAASSSGSSTGMQNFMQQLSDISQGQLSLSQSLEGLLPIPVPGLSDEQKAQLNRLAGKQHALREALEALKESAEAQQFEELLDNVVGEMEQIEEALYQHKVDRELIKRQEIVLSRLLDAQKSIRKEDYQKQRTSKPGQDIAVIKVPGPLPDDLGRDELRELIQQALKEQYPKEYEVYIREYFKALLGEK